MLEKIKTFFETFKTPIIITLILALIGVILMILLSFFTKRAAKKAANKRASSTVLLLKKIFNYLFSLIIILVILRIWGFDTNVILWTLALVAIIIGFAAHRLINDVLCGIVIVFGNYYEIDDIIEIKDIHSPELDKYTKPYTQKFLEEIELVNEVYPEFDINTYLSGEVAPVFFGSALNNFGVKELLDCFVQIAPYPRPTVTDVRTISPFEDKMTGFVFKIFANMDPNHRNRIAFLKICSGKFERNKPYLHVGLNKTFRFSSPNAFLADKKSIVEFAYPGDIVGLPDSGNFKIGDTLTEGEILNFKGIPSFSPELFRYVENADPLKFKQLAKGIDQLTDEGVAQLFTQKSNGRKIIGTVGALQFDVIQYRLEHEYGAKCRYENFSLHKACWMETTNKSQLDDFRIRKYNNLALDKQGREVFLADSPYSLQMAIEKFPDIKFHFTSEF